MLTGVYSLMGLKVRTLRVDLGAACEREEDTVLVYTVYVYVR